MPKSPKQVARVLVAWVWGISGATAVHADLDTYVFEGVIGQTNVGTLFGTKLPGQTFDGSFTLDTAATLTGIGNGGQYTTWSGGFDVVVEGVSYPVVSVAVWSSGLYTQALVPSTVDLADMDVSASVRVTVEFPFFASDVGQLTFLPEPESASLGIAAAAAIACLRARSRR